MVGHTNQEASMEYLEPEAMVTSSSVGENSGYYGHVLFIYISKDVQFILDNCIN